MPPSKRKANIRKAFKGRFQALSFSDGDLFLDQDSGLVFRHIPAGEYLRGMSEAEEAAARRIEPKTLATYEALRPVKKMDVPELLVSVKPVTFYEYVELGGTYAVEDLADTFEELYTHAVTVFNIETAQEWCKRFGLRIPTETEWEYFARGGTTSLFFFGNRLPKGFDNEGTPGYRKMEKLLNTIFEPRGDGFWGSDRRDYRGCLANPFGLYGLFADEMCSDKFLPTYDANRPVKGHVVRGGGAFLWPWHVDEWIWCISSMRSSSEEVYDDHKCAFRPVIGLEEHL